MDDRTVVELLQSVGNDVVIPMFGRLSNRDVTEKSAGDYVTVADVEAEYRIAAALHQRHPTAMIIGEEAVASNHTLIESIDSAPQVWLIDPIDGTGNFIQGNPDFGMMLCELYYGVPQRSWIWQPVRGHLYHAERDRGVWRDGVRLSRRPPVPGRLKGSSSRDYMTLTSPLILDVAPMARACAVDYPAIVDGSSDFLIHNGRHPWDHYPGILMLSELGGVVRFADGEAFSSRPSSLFRLVAAADDATWNIVTSAMQSVATPEAEAAQ